MTRRTWSVSVIRLAITILGFSWGCNSIQCKAGWQEWNEACYKLFTTHKEFSDASASCKNDSANLVSIHSSQENEFVRTLIGIKDVYIGLNDIDVEGTFVWVDGSSVAYTNWEDGEPNNDMGIDDCIFFGGSTGKWNDTPCMMWYEYLCKFTDKQPSQGKDNKAMSREQSFISYEQKALFHHVFYTKFTPSLIHCAQLCMNNPACKAINYKSELGKEEGQCELNDASAHDFPLHLMHSLYSTYSVSYG